MITATSGSTTLVESNLPPSPVSITAKSAPMRRKCTNAIAVSISNTLTTPRSPCFSIAAAMGHNSSTKSANSDFDKFDPSTRIRSVKLCRCGEVKSPVWKPEAVNPAAIIAHVLPLPFDPAICITGVARCGSPNISINRSTRRKCQSGG